MFSPHPDDETFGMGGAILLAAERDIRVTLVEMTDGARGGFDDTAGDIVQIRKTELEQAAGILGIRQIVHMDEPDGALSISERMIQRLQQLIVSYSPASVFFPSPIEFHPDHRITAELVWRALARTRKTEISAFHYEISVQSNVNRLLDITTVVERKHSAVRCFSSQLQINNYLHVVAGLEAARTYTLDNSVEAAEGFFEYPVPTGDLFGQSLQQIKSHWKEMVVRSTPLVSIIVRTKDRPGMLREALRSIAMQTWREIEVIVVNDGGIDVTDIVAEVEGSFSACRVIHHPQSRGRSSAANAGIAVAAGEYIGFLDDDDWLEPDHIDVLARTLEEAENAGFVAAYANVRCLDAVTNSVVKSFARAFDPVLLRIENYIPINALLFRRRAIDEPQACLFDDNFDLYEDWDFWLQLTAHGDFVYVDRTTANYRIHGGAGAGVDENQGYALSVLDELIEKWSPRWVGRPIREMIGRAKFLESKLLETDRLRLETDRLRLETDRQRDELSRQVAYQSEQIDELLRQQELRYEKLKLHYEGMLSESASGYEAELERVHRVYEAEVSRQESYLRSILSSRSWRMTKPLRFATRMLRGSPGRMKEIAWTMARKGYALPVLQPLYRALPVTLKQRAKALLLPKATLPVKDGQGVGSRPKVSIVIPVFNHAEHLEACLSSAVAQTYGQLEVLVCDDASTDKRVLEILSGYERIENCRVFYSKVNRGISATQNMLLEASSGEIIAFLDCDDYLEPNAVEYCVSAWETDTVYLHTGRINIDDQGEEVNRISFEHLPRKDYFKENLERMFATHFKLIRRDVFSNVGLFDQRFDSAQDYDMLMRIAFHYPSSAFIHLPLFLYFHRLHDQQTTESMSGAQHESTSVIQREARLRSAIRAGQFDKFISIVMLSFGKCEQTKAAIESIQSTVNIPFEIILFDKGSSRETVSYLKEQIEGRYGNLVVVYNKVNLGPAKGRQKALSYAKGDWFIIFDNDEIAEEGWIEELLVRASSDPDIGSVSAKVVFPDRTLQFSGGYVEYLDEELVDLGLYDRGKSVDDLSTAVFRDCDWNPIGATLFMQNPADLLHEGYPNVFEDAGVSYALKREGKRLVNCPGAWIWHEHINYQKSVDMKKRYLQERYDPKKMLVSLRSFYQENGLIIHDEYVWRENGLHKLSRDQLRDFLQAEV